MNNKYVRRAKISEAKFRQLVQFMSVDLTATQIARLTGLNRNSVNRYLTAIREKLVSHCSLMSPFPRDLKDHDVEYADNRIIIGIRESDCRVYTTLISCPYEAGKPVFGEYVVDELFDVIIDITSDTQTIFAEKLQNGMADRRKINQIESFWAYTKGRLGKFKGMQIATYNLHLKESEFRFNHKDRELYSLILKILRKDPLF